MDLAALVVAITGLLGLVVNIYIQKNKAKAEITKVLSDQSIRREELDNLEHKMVLELAAEYQKMVDPLQARIKAFEEEISSCRFLLERTEEENLNLEQVINLQERKIEHLEKKVRILEEKVERNGKAAS